MNKYNQRLAEILKEKGLNIRKLSILTGIGPSTLYSIMDRDTKIRYDYAIKIAKVLDVSACEICEEAKVFENVHTDENSMFLSPNINKIVNNASESEMKQIIELLENYYMLNDDAREQIFEQIKLMKKQQNRKNKEQ